MKKNSGITPEFSDELKAQAEALIQQILSESKIPGRPDNIYDQFSLGGITGSRDLSSFFAQSGDDDDEEILERTAYNSPHIDKVKVLYDDKFQKKIGYVGRLRRDGISTKFNIQKGDYIVITKPINQKRIIGIYMGEINYQGQQLPFIKILSTQIWEGTEIR